MGTPTKLWISTLVSLGWSVAGAQASICEVPAPEVLAQRDALAQRLDRLATALDASRAPGPGTAASGPRLSQWPNWPNWPNAWSNWRNW